MKANPDAPIEIVPGVAVPEELIFKYGYGYARYAFRPADCQLRLAYSVALHELWGAGVVSSHSQEIRLEQPQSHLFPAELAPHGRSAAARRSPPFLTPARRWNFSTSMSSGIWRRPACRAGAHRHPDVRS